MAGEADLRALLEAAAQGAQQTITSAGDLFKAMQAQWQARPGCCAPAQHRRGCHSLLISTGLQFLQCFGQGRRFFGM